MRRPAGPRAGLPAEADPGFPALKAQVIARTGHHYYADKDDLLFDRLRRRFRACGAADGTAYLARLADAAAGPAEWEALEAEITIGETFFFRYAEQFGALRDTILPGLIAARAPARTLTIWSAGCATGAEPYSVAILLHELLGDALPDWRIAITGTDISATALATARAAVFGRWALRTLPPEERRRYFVAGPPVPGAGREGAFALRPEFRRMVRFEPQNLMSLLDGTVPARLGAFDLILCRNVLIYFESEAVLGIVRGLGRRLRPDGWLLLGHAEPNPAFSELLAPVNLPGTVAYRPRDAPPPRPDPAWSPEPDPPVRPRAAPLAEPVAVAEPEGDALARIRALADAGRTAEAWRAVRAALLRAPMQAALHYYDGLLARGLGRDAEAERAFRGALYLDRDFVMAHYQLGLLLLALGRGAAAGRALDNAARLSRALSPEAPVPEGDGISAWQLAESAAMARAGLATR